MIFRGHCICMLLLASVFSIYPSVSISANEISNASNLICKPQFLVKSAIDDTILNTIDSIYDEKDSLIDVYSYEFDQKLRPAKRRGRNGFCRFDYNKHDQPVRTAMYGFRGMTCITWSIVRTYDTVTHLALFDSIQYNVQERDTVRDLAAEQPYFSEYRCDSLRGEISSDFNFRNYLRCRWLTYSRDNNGNLVQAYANDYFRQKLLFRVKLSYGPVRKPATVSQTMLEGKWNGGQLPGVCSSFPFWWGEYCTQNFSFRADSFFLRLDCSSDLIDSCHNVFVFATGRFVVNADSISLSGVYCDSNKIVKLSGCNPIGIYAKTYHYQLSGSTLYLLDQRYFNQNFPALVYELKREEATSSKYAGRPRVPVAGSSTVTGYYSISGRRLSADPAFLRSFSGVVIVMRKNAMGRIVVPTLLRRVK